MDVIDLASCVGAGAERLVDEHMAAGGAMEEVIDVLRREGHVPDRLYVSALHLLGDMRNALGSSAGLVGQLGVRVDSSRRGGHGAFRHSAAFERMRRILDGLRPHERELMRWLVTCRELERGTLVDRGRLTSGYEHARTARAYATGQIVSLLATIADGYG